MEILRRSLFFCVIFKAISDETDSAKALDEFYVFQVLWIIKFKTKAEKCLEFPSL
jgi:hypothetical protein